MKKFILILTLSMGVAICAQAQGEGKAIGVRFGWGGELSYQPVSYTHLDVYKRQPAVQEGNGIHAHRIQARIL